MAFVNLFDYSSAVRCYHFYRNYWQPKIHVPATVKNKELMKIYETYVDTREEREETPIAGSFIDGGSKIGKNERDRRKKTIKSELSPKDEIMLLHQDISKLF